MLERQNRKTYEFSMKDIALLSFGWLSIATFLSVLGASAWIMVPLILGQIIILGFLLATALKLHAEDQLESCLYSIGLGLGYAIIAGLFLNWLLPLFGILQPLSRIPLLIFFDGSMIVLLVYLKYTNHNFKKTIALPRWNTPEILAICVSVSFVIMSVVGSVILNNGGEGTISVLMLILVAAFVLLISFSKKEIRASTYASSLYLIALSLLLMYSLRTSHILGWDINEEFRVFSRTLENLSWKMSYYPGLDYNACVSITILPTIFQILTHISNEYVFKVIFQIIFAITPVISFAIARRYLSDKLAFLSAFLLISQNWFYEQMPALIRQETAFVFFLLLLLAYFSKTIGSKTQKALLLFFSGALILSHYSTSYIWFALVILAVFLSYIGKFFIPGDAPKKQLPVLLLIPVILLIIWEVPITHTGHAVVNFANHIDAGVVSTTTEEKLILQGASLSVIPASTTIATEEITRISTTSASLSLGSLQSILSKVFFAGDPPPTPQELDVVKERVEDAYGAPKGYETYAGSEEYAIESRSGIMDGPRHLPAQASSMISLLSRAVKFVLVILFTVTGMLYMFMALKRKENASYYDFFVFNVAGFALIALMVAVPYLQAYYNLTRLFLQMFFTLSIVSIIGGMALFRNIPRFQMYIIVPLIAFMFLAQSGVWDSSVYGAPRLTLRPSPAIYDLYQIHEGDIAGARWVSQNRGKIGILQSDVISNLRLQSFGNMNADNLRIFPGTILVHSSVFVSSANVESNNAYFQFANRTFVFKYPFDFLDSHKSLIYNNGQSRIYK